VFVPLRIHSVFSKGRGGATVEEAAFWAAEKRLPAAAIADVGNVYGWGKWKRAAAAAGAGLRPIFGCELEIGGHTFVFLVKSREGYRNLMEIFNRGEVRSVDGLVVIHVLAGGHDAAPEGEKKPPKEPEPDRTTGILAELREKTPPGDLYLGCGFSNFRKAVDMRAGEGPASGLPLVWANPLKFVRSPERLILLRAIEEKIPFPPERLKFAGRIGVFGPGQEALAVKRFGAGARDALDRTFEAAEKCAFDFSDIVPPLPSGLFPKSLRDVVMARLGAAKDLSWEERQRARHELGVIESSGFGPYFLIVHDVVEFARRRGILHNLRGSGASSYLAWLLGVSHVNPVEFDLYFERFLNKGRPDPPDIDIDFDSRRRDEVLIYVLEKYGRDGTGAAFVCSLKNFRARSALYETARAFGVPPDESRAMTKRVPLFAEPDWLGTAAPAPGFLDVWKLAAQLDGVHAEISLHVGGVILTPAPVERFLPLAESAKGFRMCHFDRDAVEDLRLIKLDLLSVRGLAAISETKGRLGLRTIPDGDAATYRALGEARTIGCFQVESPAMMNLLRRMKPRTIFDLVQALALVRPGPTESGMKEALLRDREGKPVERDAFLEKILPETRGILLYEEQVMQIADRVAGMPPEDGDMLRRSLKRKGGDPGLRERFFREAKERGYTEGEVGTLWRTMEKFSSYSFNKAHSASYAAMAYQAVYLKVHHTLPYLAAVLNAGGGYYDLGEYVEEAKRQGIRILGPDANRSGSGFGTEDGAIRVGLSSVKGLGPKTVEKIVGERNEGGDFLSVEDFLARSGLSKSELLALIRASVFDALEPRRTRQVLRYFQGLEDMDRVADIGAGEKERMLVDSLGFSPAGDPLDLYEGQRPSRRIRDLKGCVGTTVELVVRVVDARQIPLKTGSRYFYMFEDETGLVEGAGETKCLSFGSPPACCLRGEVRGGGNGTVKIGNCVFLKSF
jgi:DNA polymerase III alpha subunit